MSTTMSLTQVRDLPAGSTMLVQRGREVDVWTKHEDGHYAKGETRLGYSSFAGSVEGGKVHRPNATAAGDRVYDLSRNLWVMALAPSGDHDGRWYHGVWTTGGVFREITVGHVLGMDQSWSTSMVREFNRVLGLWPQLRDGIRLGEILASGQIPVERTLRVGVEVQGRTAVKPSPAQAARLLGRRGATITEIPETLLTWTQMVTVEKTTRWKCACDLITAEDLRDLSGVEKWTVLSCVGQ